jgi:hypothetical protein
MSALHSNRRFQNNEIIVEEPIPKEVDSSEENKLSSGNYDFDVDENVNSAEEQFTLIAMALDESKCGFILLRRVVEILCRISLVFCPTN